MKENETMTISELADAAGVTTRTIRYYVDEGLLPPPDTQGRYAVYDAAYLERLELIRRLKDAYLPLKEIRERVLNRSEAEVREMLAQLDAVEAPLPSQAALPLEFRQSSAPLQKKHTIIREESALDYIHTLRGEPGQEEAAAAEAAGAEAAPPEQQAMDYIHDLRKRQSITPPARKRGATGVLPGQEWRRMQVLPGLEIHVSETIYRQYEQELLELLDWISQKFKSRRV